jgi:hypothetical protein
MWGSSPHLNIPGSLQGQQSRRSALNCQNIVECLDSDLFVATFDANDHLILIANWHFQLHRVKLHHDRARGADAGIQQALEPLIAIGGKVQNAIVGCDCERHATGETGRAALHVRDTHGRCNVQHVTGGIDNFAGHRDGIGLSNLAGYREASSLGQKRAVEVENGIEHPSLRREAIPDEVCDDLLDPLGVARLRNFVTKIPWVMEFWLLFALPSGLFGPGECCAFRRFASTLRDEVALVCFFVSSVDMAAVPRLSMKKMILVFPPWFFLRFAWRFRPLRQRPRAKGEIYQQLVSVCNREPVVQNSGQLISPDCSKRVR